MAEGVGFEPTGRLNTGQTISSRSRYDHFDTSAQVLFYTTTVFTRVQLICKDFFPIGGIR